MATCIQVRELTKFYGATLAAGALDLDVQRGEIFGLLGPNGAGKSTTLYMLAGLVRPTSGSITIFGKDIRGGFLEIAARMGVLTEKPAFYDHLTVAKNLEIHSRLARKEVTLDRALDLVGMVHAANMRAGALSQGMRQRLGLAQAFLTEPELLILDEPTNGLDQEHRTEVLNLLRRLARESRVTIILSSHMIQEVSLLCDRVAVLNRGKLVACDTASTLFEYDLLSVDIYLDSTDAAARRLREENWVESVEPRPGQIHVRLKEGSPHQLATFLTAEGFKIIGVMPRRRTLQEYFLKVMNR